MAATVAESSPPLRRTTAGLFNAGEAIFLMVKPRPGEKHLADPCVTITLTMRLRHEDLCYGCDRICGPSRRESFGGAGRRSAAAGAEVKQARKSGRDWRRYGSRRS